MIKNGRPYSIEDGHIDDKLVTSHSKAELNVIATWIRDNITSDKSQLDGNTSYSIKHKLQHDTGIYLTNNEFKDAMLLCGYEPINPDELNWRYSSR